MLNRAVVKKNVHGGKFVIFFHEYDENGVCSNWYKSYFTIDGIKFNCVEQYMMYQKAMLFNNKSLAKEILAEVSPKNMKAYGRKVRGFDSSIWNRHKYNIVLTGVYNKFNQNEDLKQWLLETDTDYFVEASPFDEIWGIRLSPTDIRCLDTSKWRGENLLGKAILEAKQKIMSEKL